MDGDDISHPKRMEILYKYLQLHQEIKLVGSNIFLVDDKDNIIQRENYPKNFEDIKKSGFI